MVQVLDHNEWRGGGGVQVVDFQNQWPEYRPQYPGSYSRFQKVGIWSWDDYAGFPSSPGFGVGGHSYSNFLASTVGICRVSICLFLYIGGPFRDKSPTSLGLC